MDNITKLAGTRIRGFRKEKRLSQEELAEKCSLHPTYIGPVSYTHLDVYKRQA